MALTAEFLAGTKARASRVNESSIPVVSSTSDITVPFTGQIAFNTTDNMVYSYTGSAWTAIQATGGSTSATMHEARYNQTTLQTVSTSTDTKMSFPTSETTCDDVTASGGSNTDFLLNRAGVWLLTAAVKFVAGTANERHLWIMTGTTIGTVANRLTGQHAVNVGTAPTTLSCSTVQRLAAATSICVGLWHNNGSNLNTEVGFGKTGHISLTWLRRL